MELVTLLATTLSFLIIVILLRPFGRKGEAKKRRLQKIAGIIDNDIEEELSKPFSQRFLTPIFFGMLKTISKIIPKPKKAKAKSALERDLKLAGIRLSVREFSAVKLIIMVSSIVVSLLPMAFDFIAPAAKFLILLFGFVFAVLIPRYYLKSAIKKRQGGIRNQMPDILDLLSVSVEAGLGFDAALIRVCERATGPLVEELTTLNYELQMGKPRKTALKDLGDRNNVDELKMFLGSMIQADQLGISIKNVLKAQSNQLRLTRKQRAEEKAMKAPVKMMLPLIIFIFPVIFLILLGPSLVEIIKTFGG